MNAADSFAADYAGARDMFLTAAREAGGEIDSMPHPLRGPAGEDLAADVAWFGPADAPRVLATISATHGVEGFCGSGAQVDWLRRGEAARLPPKTAVLLIHAINPHGFAWLRRVTEDNVDLNRNWIAFDQVLPANPAYDELADAICPPRWDEATRTGSAARLGAFAREHGFPALQQALSGGQYTHPDGIFFGGREPAWSRRTQTNILQGRLGRATRVAVIDYHTGLGPWGYGERIVIDPPGSAGFQRARRCWGAGITSPSDGSSASAPIIGDGLAALPGLLPHAEVTAMALEIGTVPVTEVIEALRADAWVHAHDDPIGSAAQPINAAVRAAFYGDADDWKGMVAGQSLLAIRQALAFLSEERDH